MKFTHVLLAIFYLAILSLKPNIGLSEPTGQNLANSLVWEVTGPKINKPSYLIGTLHIMCKKDFNLDERMHDALVQSTQLYLELDFDDPNEMMNLQKLMVEKESLKDRLTAAQYAQLEKLIKENTSFNIEMFDKTHLFAIQTALLYSALDCPSKKMMDTELMTLARAKNMPVMGLETGAYQFKVINEAFPSNDRLMTDEEIEQYYSLGDEFQKMVDIYQQQDINKMRSMVSEQMQMLDNADHAIKVMLDIRNQNWVKKIPQIAADNPTLFAFGAGHLAGDQGVINLLREAGLTVTPIMN